MTNTATPARKSTGRKATAKDAAAASAVINKAPRARKAAAKLTPAEDAAVERLANAIVEPVADAIARMTKVERINISRGERKALEAWKANAVEGEPKPDTPVLDWMNAVTPTIRNGKAKSDRAPRTSTKTFTAAEHADGFECDHCHVTKPVTQFPTVKGPEVRATRCRSCRDAAKVTAA